MQVVLYTVLVLGLIGLAGAVVLYLTSRRFAVEEDSRIALIEEHLAGANCGGCGFSGCHAFATECVRRGNLEGIFCPVAGEAGAKAIAAILGCEAAASQKRVAVLRCNGSCAARPRIYTYDGARSCAVMDAVGVGTSGCSFGCLGCGDCVEACDFGALRIDPVTGLPVVDASLCTACGKCVSSCPRRLLELRPAGHRGRRVWVACSSRDRGAAARKVCSAACIGCGKCVRTCPFGAISMADNLSYIDPALCKTCGKCIGVCPTGAILATFPAPAAQSTAQTPAKP